MFKFLRDTQLIFRRSLLRTRRNPIWVFIGLFQPVLYLLLFAPLLNGLPLPGFNQTNALNIFVPGLLVMIALFSTGFAGFSIIDDLRSGVLERLRVTPASRLALLLGMVLHDVLVFLIQCGLLVMAATFMGLRANLLGLLLLFGLLALLGFMIASASYALAILVKDQSALAASLNIITLPLLLLSGVMLPLTLAPRLIQTMATFNPLAHEVNAARALVNGHFGDQSILIGFGLVIGLAVLAVFWSVRLFRQAAA